MRYVRARCEADDEEYLYRAWMTETLRLREDNKRLTRSWMELTDRTPPPPERSAEEIAAEFMERHGLTTDV